MKKESCPLNPLIQQQRSSLFFLQASLFLSRQHLEFRLLLLLRGNPITAAELHCACSAPDCWCFSCGMYIIYSVYYIGRDALTLAYYCLDVTKPVNQKKSTTSTIMQDSLSNIFLFYLFFSFIYFSLSPLTLFLLFLLRRCPLDRNRRK